MRWTQRRERLRELLAGRRCVHPGSVFDPISARIAEDLGFEVGMLAGSIASMTVLGAPDLTVLTLSELAGQAYRICRAGNLPLLIDADHGYGNALNVKRTVEELETAGVAGLTIEDTALPQPFGAIGGTQLISVEEGVGKMRAAIEGRQDPGLVIVGRTGAMSVTGVDDTVVRAKAYEAVGVDAIFLAGVRRRDQLEAVSAAVNMPIILGTPGPDVTDLDYLSGLGVRICLQGHRPFMAAVRAVHDTLKALRGGTPSGEIENVASGEMMKMLTRDDDYRRWMRDFLGGD
ncbi:MAG: isocitrate lyase/PEP mutase family protein [Proteobacteria bacterium]|nr:isocitrate lyase/PEP mutase family protein [Pseudomonadota bacterium]